MNLQNIKCHLPDSNKTAYVGIGSVRGWCGHYHRSHAAAVKCNGSDNRACSSHVGFSDRSVYFTTNGSVIESDYPMTESDSLAIESLRDEAGVAGDLELVSIIDKSLAGSEAHSELVARTFNRGTA